MAEGDYQIKALSKDIEDLILKAHKATAELLAAARASQEVEGKPQAGNVNRPGVAGADGQGGPITGPGGTPGHFNASDMISTGMAIHAFRGTRRTINPILEQERINRAIRSQGIYYAVTSISDFRAQQNAETRTGRPLYSETYYPYEGGGQSIARRNPAVEWWRISNKNQFIRLFQYGLRASQPGAFGQIGEEAMGYASDAVSYISKGVDWASNLNVPPLLTGMKRGMPLGRFGPMAAEMTAIKSVGGKVLGAIGPLGMAYLDNLELNMNYRTQQHSFAAQGPSLEKTLAVWKAREDNKREVLQNVAVAWTTGVGAAMGSLVPGVGTIIGGAIGYGIGKATTWITNLPVSKYAGLSTGYEFGEFREAQEKRRAKITEYFRQFMLGDINAGHLSGEHKFVPMSAEERSEKFLRDKSWTAEVFKENLDRSFAERNEAERLLSLGEFQTQIQGDFKGKNAADLLKTANDRIQGTAPNWSRPMEIYQMFEAGRNASRNFARSMTSRGQLRTGD